MEKFSIQHKTHSSVEHLHAHGGLYLLSSASHPLQTLPLLQPGYLHLQIVFIAAQHVISVSHKKVWKNTYKNNYSSKVNCFFLKNN